MRHQKKRHKLGRTAAHRKATMAAMATALIEHKRIETTLPKAKALRAFVEPLITRAKDDSTHNRREVFRHLRDKKAVTELFGDVASEVGDRPGGYTRVIRLGQRQGDNAEMAVIELVDWNDVRPEGAGGTKKKTRRGGGRTRRGKATDETAAPKAAKTETADAPEPAAKGKAKGAKAEVEAADAPEPAAKGKAKGAKAEAADAPEPAAKGKAKGAKAEAADAPEPAAKGKAKGAKAEAADTPEPAAKGKAKDAKADEPAAEEAPAAADDAVEAPEPAAKGTSTGMHDAPTTAADPEVNEHPDAPQGADPGTGRPPAEAGKGDQGVAGGSRHRG